MLYYQNNAGNQVDKDHRREEKGVGSHSSVSKTLRSSFPSGPHKPARLQSNPRTPKIKQRSSRIAIKQGSQTSTESQTRQDRNADEPTKKIFDAGVHAEDVVHQKSQRPANRREAASQRKKKGSGQSFRREKGEKWDAATP